MKRHTAKQDQTKTVGDTITALRQYDRDNYGVYQGASWKNGLQLVKTFRNWIDAKQMFDEI